MNSCESLMDGKTYQELNPFSKENRLFALVERVTNAHSLGEGAGFSF